MRNLWQHKSFFAFNSQCYLNNSEQAQLNSFTNLVLTQRDLVFHMNKASSSSFTHKCLKDEKGINTSLHKNAGVGMCFLP